MKITDYKKINKQKGAAMLLSVLFFLSISISIIAGLVSPTLSEYKISSDSVKSRQSYFLSESAIEDAYYRLKNGKPIGTTDTINLNGNSATATITNSGINEKTISSTGDVSSRERKNEIILAMGTGVSFNYGVQVGQGGINMSGSSGINGNVYANGPITGESSTFISGTAISGNSPALVADQSNGTDVPDINVIFGDTNTTQDIAQSFIVSTSSPLNKVSLYMRKIGSPNNATVKIVNDSNGFPGSTVYTSGVLNSSLLTTSYGWVDIAFSTNPLLNVGATYWLVVDASSSNSKYYTIGATDGGYDSGVGKIGQLGGNWNNTIPGGLDYYFKIYLGGVTGLIAGSSGSQWNQLSVGTGGSGSAQAHTVNYTEAAGLIYCQTGTGNNKSCTAQDDPAYVAFPISDANINEWKNEAASGATNNGTYNTPSNGSSHIGPMKITGDLNVGGSHTLYLDGTVWVQGNVNVSGSAKIVLSQSYGTSSGVLVSDGYLLLSGSGQLNGSGKNGSYLLFVTTSNCDLSFCAHNAIEISGAAGSVVLNAQHGTINFSGSASAKEATAYRMTLSGATTVNYESGLVNVNFTSGPSGGWNVSSWKEVE